MKLFALAAALAASGQPSLTVTSDDGLTVKTTSGHFKGLIDPRFPSVKQFLGIPFALADRWAPAKPYLSNSTFNATAPPPACPQPYSSALNVFTVSTPEFDNSLNWAEDCLGLSVWAPASADKDTKLPVFIFIHGGGLQSGSSSVAYQQPMPWIERTKNHIVVNIQYRLNIFGFPNAAGLNQTNFGLMDQRLAIEWVRDNIEAFGGDAARIVLWGQSSGAASVDAQNFAFPNDPIVSGFIQDSGTVLFPPSTGFSTADPQHSNFTFVAKGLGCNDTKPTVEFTCMKSLPAERIISFLGNYTNAMDKPSLNFIATPDDKLVFANYTERYAEGALSDRPLIVGSNRNEGVVQVPFPPFPTVEGPDMVLAGQATLSLYGCPLLETTQGRNMTRRKTYNYMYAGNFSDVSPLFWEGAYHMSELPQIFGTRGTVRAPATALEIATSDAMQDRWLAFAQDPGNAEGWIDAADGMGSVFGDDKPVEFVSETQLVSDCAKLKSQMTRRMTMLR